MNPTLLHGARTLPTAPAESSTGLRRGALATVLPVLVLVVAAFALRAVGLARSFELWVDEMLYADLGASVARGELPNLPDGPFFLHPPGFFLVEAAVIQLFGLGVDAMPLVYQLRWVSAVAGALSVGLIFLVLRRPVGVVVAFAAGVLAVFEPFVLRNNSRVFLETTGMFAVLVGLVLVVGHLTRPAARWRLVVAGLALGYGVFTKDVLVAATIIPVALAALWRRTLARRDAAVLVAAALVPYTAYLVVLGFAGRLDGWAHAKEQGVLRALGIVQSTGFNAPNAPSLVDRVLAQVGSFGTSYVLLLVCPLAGAVAALSARPERRYLGLVALVTGGFGVYSAAFGTFEEQYGYPVMVTGIVASAVAAVELAQRFPRARRAITGVCLAFVAAAAVLGVRAETTTDDGFLQVRDWTRAHLPADARVGVTNGTGQLAFANDQRFGPWASLPDLADHRAQYVLTQSLPTELGYGFAQSSLLPWLAANARPMIAVPGPTNGVTTLWYIDPAALARGADARVAYPARSPDLSP